MTVNPLAKTAEPTGFRKFIRADKTQRVLLIVSFMFVPLVLLLMFTYIPFGKMVQFSFYNRNYLSEGTFVGLANYIEVFKRDDIFGSLIVSVYYMGGAVVQLVLALFFASLMVFKVKGEGIYKACMFFPYLSRHALRRRLHRRVPGRADQRHPLHLPGPQRRRHPLDLRPREDPLRERKGRARHAGLRLRPPPGQGGGHLLHHLVPGLLRRVHRPGQDHRFQDLYPA